MQTFKMRRSFVAVTSKPGLGVFLISLGMCVPATAQSASPAAPQIKLQPYTAPDQSVSAGVPTGWKVTKGGNTVVVMAGAQGETISLGTTVVVRNAPFQLGQRPSAGIDLSMPNSANLMQKFTMIVQQNAAISGSPAPQLTIASAAPIQMPPVVGQCGRIVARDAGAKTPMTLAALICSLPIDAGGTYKVMFKLASAPSSVAAQESALAAAVFASYQVPAAWLKKKLAPNTPAPAAPKASASGATSTAAQTAAILRATAAAQAASDTQFNCFDLIAIRETPTYQLPKACGGPK